MKIKALNKIKHDGKYHLVGEVFEVDKKTAETLKDDNAAEEVGGTTPASSKIDAQVLYDETEDFNTLKKDQLKAICTLLGLPISGKNTELAAAIEEIRSKDGNVTLVDMSEMDKSELIALAEEEGVKLPDDADEEQIRDILAEALVAED